MLELVLCIGSLLMAHLPVSLQQERTAAVTEMTVPENNTASVIKPPEYITISEKFTDWKHWSINYPSCDSTKNWHQSPINIITSSATRHLDKRVKPIVVFAGSPTHTCFFLSIVYKTKELEMEVVAILPLPECETTISHITGAGEKVKDRRYFRRALIMFTKSDVTLPQSLHTIDGKSFQMEISMEFVDLNQNELPSTELHILVEAKPFGEVSENPVFKPLEETIPSLKEEILSEAYGKTERALKYKHLESVCIAAKRNYTRILSSHHNLTECNNRIDQIEEILSDIGLITNRKFRLIMKQRFDARAHGPIDNTVEHIQEQLKRLEKKKKDLKEMLYIYTDQQVRRMLFETKARILMLTRILLNAKKGNSPHIKKSPEERYKIVVDSLRKHKIGIPDEPPYPGQLYDGPDVLHDELEKLRAIRSSVLEYKREKDRFCREFEDFQRHESYGFVPITVPFQISWLFPQTGGFYLYNGSDPIPPCTRRKHSIVFEHPIQITTEQLAVFQSLPSLLKLRREAKKGNTFSGSESDLLVDKMIPVISTDKRRVTYVPKSPVYLSDDGLHKMAKPKSSSDPIRSNSKVVAGKGRSLISDKISNSSKQTILICQMWLNVALILITVMNADLL